MKLVSRFFSPSGLALPRFLAASGCAGLLIFGCIYWFVSEPVGTIASPAPLSSPKNKPTSHGELPASTTFQKNLADHPVNPRVPDARPQSSPTPSQSEKERILEQVHEAAVTYDPASLPMIAPHLNSPDPDVRMEAMNAVVTLGDAAGAPLLRAQAVKETDEARKSELLRLANWLELPPAKLVLPKKKTQPTQSPVPR